MDLAWKKPKNKAIALNFTEHDPLIRELAKRTSARAVNVIIAATNWDMLTKGTKAAPEDAVSADEEIRDPLVLEFLNLRDEYSESDLEVALIRGICSVRADLSAK